MISFKNILLFIYMQIVVESLETGFLVNIYSEKSCPGLLGSILEVFDELGLHVMEARVSCADSFRLEALGGEVRYIYEPHIL